MAPVVAEIARRAEEIEHLTLKLRPEGLVLSGQYPTPFGLKIPFETLWHLEPGGRMIQARVISIHLSGLNASLFRGVLMHMITEMIANEPGLSLDGETLLIDTIELAKLEGIDLQVNWREIRTGEGSCQLLAAEP
ncbi:MAG: hypothetical protein SNJ82_06780 [Gemmataceae bacterium]